MATSPKTPPISPTAIRAVEVLAFPEVQLLDIAGPLQVFSSANERCAERGLLAPYAPRVVASTPEITATAGLSFAATPLPPLTDGIDTLVVAGDQGVMRAADDGGLVGWVASRGAKARARRLGLHRRVYAGRC